MMANGSITRPLEGRIKVVQGTVQAKTTSQIVVSDNTLKNDNYIVLGYAIVYGGNRFTWYYAAVMDVRITENGVEMQLADASVGGNTIYIVLFKL